MTRKEQGSGILSRLSPDGCLRWFVIGCLLPFVCLISALPVAAVALSEIVVPFLETMDWGDVLSGQSDTIEYLGEEEREMPLPEDVVLEEDLDAFAESRGLENYFGRYYQAQSCIAAAEFLNVERRHLCAIMDLEEGKWAAENIKAETYVTALWKAAVLREAGYRLLNPIAQDTAVLFLLGGQEELLPIFHEYARDWRIADTARIIQPTDDDWQRGPALIAKYATLNELGYLSSFEVNGQEVVIINPEIPPPRNLPPVGDGTLTHPCPGCSVSGHRFRISSTGKPKPNHRATDYGGGDGNGYAAHNGTVSVVGWDKDGYGNFVILKDEFSDGTPFCTLYAHGQVNIRKVGDKLRGGIDVVFKIGSTGNSTGTHLHVEIRIGGNGPYCAGATYVDPEKWFPSP